MIDELKVHLVSKITASVQGTISKNASENDYLELEVNIAEAIFDSFREEFLLQCNEYFKMEPILNLMKYLTIQSLLIKLRKLLLISLNLILLLIFQQSLPN